MADRVAPVLALALSALLAGCAQWRHYELGQPIAAAQVPVPEHGWTVSQVMAEFGPPLRMSAEPSGYSMSWEYWEIDEYKVGIGSFITGVDLINIDWGKASAQGDFMLLSFSHDHRLLSASFQEWDRDAGGGQGVQPLFSAVDVVDVDDLLKELSQHRWGAQSLRRTPVTLNQQNRLDSGQAGIEQRGGTRRVGQHSLELR
jgi:hypothetical protein